MTSILKFVKHPSLSLIDKSTTLKELTQIHTQLLTTGSLNSQTTAQFVAFIAIKAPLHIAYADRILHRAENPTLFALNSMIRAHSKGPTPHKSFQYYNLIRNTGSPDNYTFNFLVRSCRGFREIGWAVHGAVLKHGFENDPHVISGLISMYAEFGFLKGCFRVFEGVTEPDSVGRTTMMSACVKCGDMQFARELFDEMSERDCVAWNAIIAGYAQCGESREALSLFEGMQLDGVKVNQISMISVLSACSQLGALDHGRWAHAYVERNKIRMTVSLGTALIDMYAKCGDMEKAMEVFWGMRERNVYTWTSAMNGLAMNGAVEKCLELFSLMKRDGVEPNEVTFVSILRACSVVGFVEEGCKYFESMRNVYGIEPRHEHYGCMVDLYGRAGRLDEALAVINGMPLKPHAQAWGALLNACKIYKNMELGELASKKLVELESRNHGAYVLLSNIYADSKDWERANQVRREMKSKHVKKQPGCSVLEVDGEVHEFFVGNKSHPRYSEIEVKMREISKRLKLAGYVANTNPVLFDIEEEEKEDTLCYHSEKVAIAFGLISLKEGIPIRIRMNLRVCWDCHGAAKMISKVFNREIIIRDTNRFHHFKDGECSCKEFW